MASMPSRILSNGPGQDMPQALTSMILSGPVAMVAKGATAVVGAAAWTGTINVPSSRVAEALLPRPPLVRSLVVSFTLPRAFNR